MIGWTKGSAPHVPKTLKYKNISKTRIMDFWIAQLRTRSCAHTTINFSSEITSRISLWCFPAGTMASWHHITPKKESQCTPAAAKIGATKIGADEIHVSTLVYLTQRTRLPQKTAGTEQEDFISGWTLTEQRCTAIWIMSELWSSLIYFGLKSDLVYRRYVASLNVDLSAHNELDEIILWTFGVWIRSARSGLEVKWGTWRCGNKWWGSWIGGHEREILRSLRVQEKKRNGGLS